MHHTNHDTSIAANLPTYQHDGHVMLQLTGGSLMLGERGIMVAMGRGLRVYFCVHGETTKNKEESKNMNVP